MRAIHLHVLPDFTDCLDMTEKALQAAKAAAVEDLHNIVVMRATAAYQRRLAAQRTDPNRGA